MEAKQSDSLRSFVRNECANYRDGCLFGQCAVLEGRRCGYFERAVLGPPDYPYKTAGYDWQKLFAAYGRINPKFAGRGVSVRRCPDCGEVLQPRQRYCEKCKSKHRKAAYREYRKTKGSTRHN